MPVDPRAQKAVDEGMGLRNFRDDLLDSGVSGEDLIPLLRDFKYAAARHKASLVHDLTDDTDRFDLAMVLATFAVELKAHFDNDVARMLSHCCRAALDNLARRKTG